MGFLTLFCVWGEGLRGDADTRFLFDDVQNLVDAVCDSSEDAAGGDVGTVGALVLLRGVEDTEGIRLEKLEVLV